MVVVKVVVVVEEGQNTGQNTTADKAIVKAKSKRVKAQAPEC